MKLKLFKEFNIFENLDSEISLETLRKITQQAFPDIPVHLVNRKIGDTHTLFVNKDESLIRYKNSYSIFLMKRHKNLYIEPFNINQDIIDSFMELSSYLKENENITSYKLEINVGINDGTRILYKDFEYDIENLDEIDEVLNKYINSTFNTIKIYYKCSLHQEVIDMIFNNYKKEFDIFDSPSVEARDSKDSKMVFIRRKNNAPIKLDKELMNVLNSYIDVMKKIDYELEYISPMGTGERYRDINELYSKKSSVSGILINTKEL